jgi:hypothetical protein
MYYLPVLECLIKPCIILLLSFESTRDGILRIAVADNERHPRTTPSGLPYVSPDAVEAFKSQSHDFEESFFELKEDNPVLAQDLTTGYDALDPLYLAKKRAFAAGALYVYGLLMRLAEANRLAEQFELTDGDDDGEDRPLSA